MYRWGGRVKSCCVHAIICCLNIDINKLIAKIMPVSKTLKFSAENVTPSELAIMN